MKLYSFAHSPYAARVRMAIYARGLPVEVLPPPGGGGKSPEYLALNPLGKVPSLKLDDGTVIPESDTLVEFLADAFPDSGLRPTRAADIARGRLLSRISDLYLLPHGLPLIGLMAQRTRDAAVVDAAFARMDEGFAHLEAFMTGDRYAVGDTVTTADCTLVPVLFFMGVFGQMFDRGNLLARHGKVAGYWSRMQQDTAAQKVLGELREGLRHLGGHQARWEGRDRTARSINDL